MLPLGYCTAVDVADVKFDITEMGSSSIWDEGEIQSLQGGSATGLTDILYG